MNCQVDVINRCYKDNFVMLQKVIKAVIALNRFGKIIRERREQSVPCKLSQSADTQLATKDNEIQDFKESLEQRISYIPPRKELKINKQHEKQLSRTDTGVTPVPVTSSMSCSSGYESSGSTKSTATMEEIPLLVNTIENLPENIKAEDCKGFERMESLETLVNDEIDSSKKSENMNAPTLYTKDHSISYSEAATGPQTTASSKESVDTKNTYDIKETENQARDIDIQALAISTDSDSDDEVVYMDGNDLNDRFNDIENGEASNEVQKFLSDSGDDESVSSYRSDKQCYCPTDTLDDLVSTITGRTDSGSSIQSTSCKNILEKASHPNSRSNSCDKQPSLLQHVTPSKGSGNNSNPISSNSESDSPIPVHRGRSSRVESGYTINSRRSSRVESGDIKLNRTDSPEVVNSGNHSSDIPRYGRSRSRRSSIANSASDIAEAQIQRGRHENSPAPRYPRSSRNNSREHSVDQDLKDMTPVGQQHYWPTSAFQESYHPEQRRRQRIAALCGEEYTPSPSSDFYHLTERVIPIEIEQSPPPMESQNRLYKYLVSKESADSNSSFQQTPYARDILSSGGRVRTSPKRSDFDVDDTYSSLRRVRRSPARDPELPLNRIRESPARSGPEGRRSRIAAILAGSTESLDQSGDYQSKRTRPTDLSNSQEAIDCDQRYGSLSRLQGSESGSRSSSRNNSDDSNRHRRIAAILAKSK